jgi:hypothetical protein
MTDTKGPEKERRVAALIGMFAAHSPLSAVAQQTVVRMCEAGYVEEITEALAHALLQHALASGKIPPNAGKKKQVPDIDAACIYVAKAYSDSGGALLARGWVESWRLAAVMLRQWNAEFSPEIPVTRKILGMPEQEVADRVCVAVLNCRAKFLELIEPDEALRGTAEGDLEAFVCYPVAKEELETLLSALVKAALEAFDDPNTVNHRLLHGPKP